VAVADWSGPMRDAIIEPLFLVLFTAAFIGWLVLL
jgi:hypothetical protein